MSEIIADMDPRKHHRPGANGIDMTTRSAMNSANEQEGRVTAALAARQFEIDLFWKRSLFFWGFIASAFVGFATTYARHPHLAIAISCFGLVCSFCWTMVNRGSKFWYEAWEQMVRKEPIGELFDAARSQPSKSRWWSPRFSVSKLAIVLSDYVTGLWLVLTLYQLMSLCGVSSSRWGTIGAVILVLLSLVYIGYAFMATRTHQDLPATSKEASGSAPRTSPDSSVKATPSK